tara:strand:+ start:47 stop:262 length:216 start_codon:yes stop_codon:yes gene_type:complete
MKYEIPEDEKCNVLSIYWQMLQEIESRTDPKRQVLDAHLVQGAYNVLNRIGSTDARPRWESQDDTTKDNHE